MEEQSKTGLKCKNSHTVAASCASSTHAMRPYHAHLRTATGKNFL